MFQPKELVVTKIAVFHLNIYYTMFSGVIDSYTSLPEYETKIEKKIWVLYLVTFLFENIRQRSTKLNIEITIKLDKHYLPYRFTRRRKLDIQCQ